MMKKQMILFALMLIACVSASAQKSFSVYGVGFYNLENLFDTQHDEGKNDYEFLPEGSYKWNDMKYSHKLHNMARVLSELGTDVLPGIGCAAIGVSEVENAKCLTDLCDQEPLKQRGYKFVHVEGPDQRGVDCALLLVEPIAHVGAPEQALIARIREEQIPAILCVNKIDTVEKASLLPVMAAYHEAWDGFRAIIPISARTGEGLEELCDEIRKYAEEGPQLFPDGQTSDQPERQVMGELLREKLLLCLDKEIPHGVAVEISRFSEREDSGIVDVDAVIYCEKASHKGIIIGKHGDMLKKVSSLARHDMEKFMGTKVYLQTWVKVKENWRDSVSAVRSFGYRDSD